jgi:transcription elongation factor
MKIRPQQRLFDILEVKKIGGDCVRKYHPMEKRAEKYDYWNNDYYKEGFMYKDVNPLTFLQTDNIKPTMEEMRMYTIQKEKKIKEFDDPYQDEYDSEKEEENEDVDLDENGEPRPTQSLIKDIAEQLRSLDTENQQNSKKNCLYVVGDMVQVINGELTNLIGKIVSINVLNQTVTVVPHNSSLTDKLTIEMSVLSKYVPAGSHVKVLVCCMVHSFFHLIIYCVLLPSIQVQVHIHLCRHNIQHMYLCVIYVHVYYHGM